MTTAIEEEKEVRINKKADNEEKKEAQTRKKNGAKKQRFNCMIGSPFISKVGVEKKEADETVKFFVPYFKKDVRKTIKIQHDEKGILSFPGQNSHAITVKSGKYMYVIGLYGALYGCDYSTIHSQLKAGKPVQSAGHLYVDNNHQITAIDNSSGHYQPTLVTFLLSVYGLMREGYISSVGCRILINSFTKDDSKTSKEIFHNNDLAKFFIEAAYFIGKENVIIKVTSANKLQLSDGINTISVDATLLNNYIDSLPEKEQKESNRQVLKQLT